MTGDRLRERVRGIATALPEVTADGEGPHVGYRVRKKTFLWFLDDHHGDGRVVLHVKAAPGAQQALVGADPVRFHVPSYLGARGWVGIDLEAPGLDWDEVSELVREAYRLTAPKRLAAEVE
ncbi:MmcQ/YjbR family DNA-binding protein [Micromonospora echinaurantiaca]|uniref:MmcQ/YjbR family DNA-binding protein n=1 Tax=Micromonospora echinaurantiaca TaxID=47857 RepID=UPI0034470427